MLQVIGSGFQVVPFVEQPSQVIVCQGDDGRLLALPDHAVAGFCCPARISLRHLYPAQKDGGGTSRVLVPRPASRALRLHQRLPGLRQAAAIPLGHPQVQRHDAAAR